jgi:hemerythrin-like domain-containing protein
MPMNSPTWLIRFRELQRAVEDHVDQEENQVFPQARDIISPELAEEIDQRYRIERARGIQEPIIDEIVPPPEQSDTHASL